VKSESVRQIICLWWACGWVSNTHTCMQTNRLIRTNTQNIFVISTAVINNNNKYTTTTETKHTITHTCARTNKHAHTNLVKHTHTYRPPQIPAPTNTSRELDIKTLWDLFLRIRSTHLCVCVCVYACVRACICACVFVSLFLSLCLCVCASRKVDEHEYKAVESVLACESVSVRAWI